jgi:RHS repeat-associated protein
VETKTIDDGSTTETYTYVYNLQNRLAKVTRTVSGSTIADITEYKYNPEGIRVESHSWTEDDGVPQGDDEITSYLIDAYNHTGYAQVFVEDDGTDTTSYVIGDDVLAQATNTSNPEYLLYDGHGSTRQTTDNAGVVTDSFSYDAYGMLLGNPASTTTNLLYTGEQFDDNLGQYYLRARYYDPLNGRFNRVDPFSGNTVDPQSLHKYNYAHNNPVNGVDPSGKFTSFVDFLLAVAIGLLIVAVWRQAFITVINIGQGIRGRSGNCGQDVTQQLRDLNVHFDYATRPSNMNSDERNRRCRKRKNPVTGWDINILHSKLVGGSSGSCDGTATVSGKCYDQSAINYYLWGKICKYCGDSEDEAILRVFKWKLIRGGEWHAIQQAYDFTSAGYRSWEDFDRPPLNVYHHTKCKSNSTPYVDLRFIDHYHWGEGGPKH